MSKLLAQLGWAAGRVYGHARLLTIDRDDPQGSAAVEDETEVEDEKLERDIVDEDDRLDDDDLDDQPRGKRGDKSAQAYDKLKSERDRLQAEAEKKDRLLQEVSTRLERIEQGRESRQTVNERTDEQQLARKQRARDMAERAKALDRNDPEYTAKVYEIFLEEQEAVAKDTSLRTSSEVVQARLTMDEQRARAQQAALAELERQGLTKENFKLLRAMAAVKNEEDPGWDRRMPNEEQIPHLVGLLKEQLVKTTRQNPSFREEKAKHRASMDGVIGDGSRSGERRERGERDGGTELGSTLDDLAKLRASQRQNTSRMLRTER